MNKGSFAAACVVAGAVLGTAFHLGSRPGTDPEHPSAPAAGGALVGVPIGTGTNAIVLDPSGREIGTGNAPGSNPAPPTPVRRAAIAPALSYHDGIMRAAPSVVSLYAGLHERIAGGGGGGGPRPRLSQGSGVIVDPAGIVLTNFHLVEEADVINVVLGDGTLHVGSLVGSDRETDLAVVRIDTSGMPEGALPAMRLDDAPPLRVGDVVLAIGNPFGVGQTVTQGIVSATRRRVAGASAWQDFVQIDAAINPGSSGGALINPAGQLVGVTTAVFRGRGDTERDRSPILDAAPASPGTEVGLAEGIGFAIPAGLLARVVPEIIADGHVVRGWLGIGADDLPMYPALHRRIARGAVITDVEPGSPAESGDLRPGDVVTAVDGQGVEDATDLLLLIASLGPGASIELSIDRDGRSRTLLLSLGERPPAGN